jgi:hypothetical protein
MTELQYILILGLAALFLMSFYGLSRYAGKVHAKLYQLQNVARQSETIEDLCQAEQRLRAYAQKHCYHRHLASHAREILAYIQGRKQEMQKQ